MLHESETASEKRAAVQFDPESFPDDDDDFERPNSGAAEPQQEQEEAMDQEEVEEAYAPTRQFHKAPSCVLSADKEGEEEEFEPVEQAEDDIEFVSPDSEPDLRARAQFRTAAGPDGPFVEFGEEEWEPVCKPYVDLDAEFGDGDGARAGANAGVGPHSGFAASAWLDSLGGEDDGD